MHGNRIEEAGTNWQQPMSRGAMLRALGAGLAGVALAGFGSQWITGVSAQQTPPRVYRIGRVGPITSGADLELVAHGHDP
jgi:hypothetical protein